MAEMDPKAETSTLDEIDAYKHRQFMKRVAKERELAEKNGNTALEKDFRQLLQDLDKPDIKRRWQNESGFANALKAEFKRMVQTGQVNPEVGTVSVTEVPVEEPKVEKTAKSKKTKSKDTLEEVRQRLKARSEGKAFAVQRPPTIEPGTVEAGSPQPAVEVPASTAAATPEAAVAATKTKANVRGKLGLLRSKPVMAGVGALAALGLIRTLAKKPEDTTSAVNQFEKQAAAERSKEVARLLERARLERAIRENQMRLARGNPDLYTSVMAGRRVPKGSVVLGGVPRQDLMRELAASMDSGRYAQPDPLSDLMG